MKKFIFIIFIFLCSAAFSCDNPIGEQICATIKFQNGLSRKHDSSFKISFFDRKNKKLFFEKIPEMELWMVMKSGHGHGSDKLKITTKDKNSFLVENVWFMMLGQWQLKIQLSHHGAVIKSEVPICLYKNAEKSGLGKCQ